jgi:hypothetical protein
MQTSQAVQRHLRPAHSTSLTRKDFINLRHHQLQMILSRLGLAWHSAIHQGKLLIFFSLPSGAVFEQRQRGPHTQDQLTELNETTLARDLRTNSMAPWRVLGWIGGPFPEQGHLHIGLTSTCRGPVGAAAPTNTPHALGRACEFIAP